MRRLLNTSAVWSITAIVFVLLSFTGFTQQMYAPGKLDPKHSKFVKKCSGCHRAYRGAPDKLCLKCHREIAKELKNRDTIHARTSKTCESCHLLHKEEVSPKTKIYHLKSNFYSGKHFSASCKRCHEFLSTKTRRLCSNCHTVKNHYTYSKNCNKCHQMPSWNKVMKQHNKKSVCDSCHALSKGHKNYKQNCSKCHLVNSWKTKNHLSKKPCVGCHKQPKNHYLLDCKLCHQSSQWKEIAHPQFNGHDYNDFSCARCHPKNNFSAATCLPCHARENRDGLDVILKYEKRSI